jgi:hypothetical protein
MKIKIRHNSLMRLIFGILLLVVIPGIAFVALWPLVGWQWALVLPAAWVALMVYGFFFGWRHLVVRTATCESALLPEAFDGYKVLQLSDIHIGTFLRNRGFIDKLVNVVNAQQADLIVFMGDLVNVSAEEVIPFQGSLKHIHARDGIYSVMGNHDYCEYGPTRATAILPATRTCCGIWRRRWAGACCSTSMSSSTAPGGGHRSGGRGEHQPPTVPRPWRPAQGHGRPAPRHVQDSAEPRPQPLAPTGAPPDRHRPDALGAYPRRTDALRQVSRRPNWAYNEWGGKYVEGGSMLYVSLGIGGTVPFRFGAWPEVNVIRLKKKKLIPAARAHGLTTQHLAHAVLKLPAILGVHHALVE